jgi:hypothetical protein
MSDKRTVASDLMGEVNDGIRQVEQSFADQAPTALNAIHRAAMVRDLIDHVYALEGNVQVYAKGKGYGVRMGVRDDSETRLKQRERRQDKR